MDKVSRGPLGTRHALWNDGEDGPIEVRRIGDGRNDGVSPQVKGKRQAQGIRLRRY